MKKIYFLAAGLLIGGGAMAQGIDTLTSHFTGTPSLLGASGGGYVSGNNDYGDKAKMQFFDGEYGVVGTGTISKVLLWVPAKEDNGGSFQVKIWSNAAGAPGTELGTTTVTLASVDTTLGGVMIADGTVGYNVIATFGAPVNIPANQRFWAGVVLPATAGDTIGLAHTADGAFPDAITHTGEWWSDNTFHTFGDPANWNLDVALAIYPIVNITTLSGIEENSVVAEVYPNPTNGLLNFNFVSNETSHIVVRDLAGRTVATVEVNAAMSVQADFSALSNGTYLYETVDFEGVVTSKSKFVKQ